MYSNESNKFDGSKYVNWKLKIQTLMEGEKVWCNASIKDAKPEAFPNSIQYWERRERQEIVLLRMSMKENIVPHIKGCKTSIETWEILKCLYEITNTHTVIFLKCKFLSIKMKENENVNNILSRIKELKDKLHHIGENISSKYLVIEMLTGMLEEYKLFIIGLVDREKYLVFDEMEGIILQEEE
jgi:hypothetical protein